MENDNKDFPVPPGCDPVPLSAHQTNPYHVMLGGTTSCIDKTSTNFPPLKSVSGITQRGKGYSVQGDCHCVTTVPPECSSHQSSSGATMSSVQSNLIASNFLPTHSKNEDPNPDHDPFDLSLGKRVLDGIAIKNKQGAKLQGRDSSKLGFWEPNSNDYIFSNMQYDASWKNQCSIQSSPSHFHSPHCGHDTKCLPHTINENSNQSFECNQTEKCFSQKISEGRGPLSSPITGFDMPLLSTIEYSKPPHYSAPHFASNDPGINLFKSQDRYANNSWGMSLKRPNELDSALFRSSFLTSDINHHIGGFIDAKSQSSLYI
jgi:hypothetical protein